MIPALHITIARLLLLAFLCSLARGEAPSAITLAPLGDSRTAIVSYDGVPFRQLSTQSHLNWANALNQQKFPCIGNFGISGAASDKIIAEMLKPALATQPTYMPILMGVNDVRVPGFNAEHTMANIAKAADAALAQGTIPILFTDPGGENYVAAQVEFINDLNARIKAYCAATPKAILFDMADLVSTQRTPTIVFKPGWFYDGVHLQTLGAYKIGDAFATLMNACGVEAPVYPGLSGNLLHNAGLEAPGGKIGDGTAGTLPDGFAGTLDKPTCAAEYAVNTRADGVREIVVVVKNGDAKVLAGTRVSQSIAIVGIEAEQALQAGVQVEIDKGSINLGDVRVQLDLKFEDGTFDTVYDFETSMAREGKPVRDTISNIPDVGPLLLTLQSPKIACPPGKVLSGITFRLGARIAGEGSATVRFRKPWCKKV